MKVWTRDDIIQKWKAKGLYDKYVQTYGPDFVDRAVEGHNHAERNRERLRRGGLAEEGVTPAEAEELLRELAARTPAAHKDAG